MSAQCYCNGDVSNNLFTAERELVLDLFPFCSNQLAVSARVADAITNVQSADSEEEGQSNKRRKGVKNEEKYRRNVIKKSKVEGKEHVNWKGKTVPAKNPGSNVCR
ncbi:hypothetical protein J6590_031769 [Homalodisca vitripennis]|nr:hypothetical protein J6590_031769 [Homalodisca vitripennis]